MMNFTTIDDVDRMVDDVSGVMYGPGDYSGGALLHAVRNSQERVYIVAGRLFPEFYSGPFSDSLAKAHANSPEISVNVLANLGATTLEEAHEKLREANSRLVEVMQQIQDANMYWSEDYSRYHFAVADDFLLQEERDHLPGEERRVVTHATGGKEVDDYVGQFERMVRDPRVHQMILGYVQDRSD